MTKSRHLTNQLTLIVKTNENQLCALLRYLHELYEINAQWVNVVSSSPNFISEINERISIKFRIAGLHKLLAHKINFASGRLNTDLTLA
jgi:hypothetical protein